MLEQIFGKPDFHGVRKLSERVYVYFSYVNTTIIVADDGVCLIDSQVNLGQVKRLMAEVRKITPLPIKWVINTHYHWDHVIGNRFFKEQGAQIVAHDLTRHYLKTRMKRQWAFLKGRGFTMEEPEPTLPDLTYKGEMNMNLPGVTMHLRHLGSAETDDATAIYLPNENLIATGDSLLTGSFPIFGMAVMNEGLNESRSWLGVLNEIRDFKAQNLIPGHGPLGSESDLELMCKVQTFFLDAVEKYVNDGLTLPLIQEKIRAELPDYVRRLPEVWGTVNYAIYRCYHSLTGWLDYKPTAIPFAKEAELVRILAATETSPESLENEIAGALKEERWNAALSLAQHLASEYPEEAQHHARFAEVLIETSRLTSSILEKGDFFALAKKSLDEALEIDPLNGLALLVKGMFYIVRAEKNGTDPMEGIAILQKAALSPQISDRERAKIQFGLSVGYIQCGQFQDAVLAAKQAQELDPNYRPAQKLLAEISKRQEGKP